MASGGCKCALWRKVISEPDTKLKTLKMDDSENSWWTLGNYFIEYCPWCGSPLTPPEE